MMLQNMNIGIPRKYENSHIRSNMIKSPIYLSEFIHNDVFYLIFNAILNEAIQIQVITKHAIRK